MIFTSGFKIIDKLEIDIEPDLIDTVQKFWNLSKSIKHQSNQTKTYFDLSNYREKFDYSKKLNVNFFT